jgi:hypothetical protein
LRGQIGLRGWFRSGLCSGLRSGRFADALVDHSLGKLDPAPLGREAGVGPHGADDGVAGDVRVFHFFHDEVERGAGVLNALGGEAKSLSVAVDRRMVSELVLLNDFVGIAPVEEVLLELGAARVIANAALTGVADDFRVGDVSASFRLAGVHQSTPFAASDNFVDVHVTSSRARHICPTHVNRMVEARSIVETTYGIRITT